MSQVRTTPVLAKVFSTAVATTLVLFASAASAAPILYGNFPAATVDYVGVQEESSTDPARNVLGSGLFGSPTIGGDTMDFNPQAFAANATNGSSDITDSNLQFMIVAHPGQAITGVVFTEAGDTSLTGFVDASSSVVAKLFVEIAEVNNLPFFLNVPVADLAFSPSGGTYLMSQDGTLGLGYATAWSGSVLVDLSVLGISGAITKVNVTIDNTLTAASQVGSSAFIQKKDADGLVITTVSNDIPEPTSIVTAMSALAFAGGLIRRRK